MRWKKRKRAGGALLVVALLLAGCGDMEMGDAGMDAGASADSGTTPVDAGEPTEDDAGRDGSVVIVDGGVATDGGATPDGGTALDGGSDPDPDAGGCMTGIYGTSTFGAACFGD